MAKDGIAVTLLRIPSPWVRAKAGGSMLQTRPADQAAAAGEADVTEFFTQFPTKTPRLWLFPSGIFTPPSALVAHLTDIM